MQENSGQKVFVSILHAFKMGLFLVYRILLLHVLLVPIISLSTQLTLDVLYERVRNLTAEHPNMSSLIKIGSSVENRPIFAVKIQKGVGQNSSVVVECGIHGRELASVASGLFVMEKLLTNTACNGLLERIIWYIIPVLNPDGYKYSVEIGVLWRKNRARIPSSSCVGIDLNRNFPVGWENETDSSNFCKQTFCGDHPISEPESMALKTFLDGLTNGTNTTYFRAYVAVHTCAPGMFYPYGYKLEKAHNYVELEFVGKLMQSSIKNIAGTEYQVAPANVLGLCGGAVDEWVYDTYRVPLVYTLELDRDYLSYHCFFASEKAIKRLSHECFAGLEALGGYLSPNALTKQKRAICYSYEADHSRTTSFSVLLAWMLLFIYVFLT